MNKHVGLFLILLLTTISGCREVRNYAYRPVQLDTSEGMLLVQVIGHYGPNYEAEGKQLLDWGFPYNIQFSYRTSSASDVARLELTSIRLSGKETGTNSVLADIETSQPRIYDETKLLRVSAGPLTADSYTYQDYVLSAQLTIHSESGASEVIDISIELLKDYSTGRQSDWLDKQMGV